MDYVKLSSAVLARGAPSRQERASGQSAARATRGALMPDSNTRHLVLRLGGGRPVPAVLGVPPVRSAVDAGRVPAEAERRNSMADWTRPWFRHAVAGAGLAILFGLLWSAIR